MLLYGTPEERQLFLLGPDGQRAAAAMTRIARHAKEGPAD
jgi:hypothetical protein